MARGKFYTFQFALIICVMASFIVSVTAIGLKDRKELNVELDRKKKILNAMGRGEDVNALTDPHAVLGLYDDVIKAIVVDLEGNVILHKMGEEITEEEKDSQLPVYIMVQDGRVDAVAIPVSGYGLWSTLYGYLALDKDLDTVRGITFYKHGETPGLGGEIEKPWFQNNFIGKKIFGPDNQLVSIKVIKGEVEGRITDPEEKLHSVDGISGATITSNGVTKLLEKWLKAYEPFLRKVQKQGVDTLI